MSPPCTAPGPCPARDHGWARCSACCQGWGPRGRSSPSLLARGSVQQRCPPAAGPPQPAPSLSSCVSPCSASAQVPRAQLWARQPLSRSLGALCPDHGRAGAGFSSSSAEFLHFCFSSPSFPTRGVAGQARAGRPVAASVFRGAGEVPGFSLPFHRQRAGSRRGRCLGWSLLITSPEVFAEVNDKASFSLDASSFY